MAKLKTSYICQNCGSVQSKWMGRCPECNQWNSFVEEVVEKKSKSDKITSNYVPTSVPVELSSVTGIETSRFPTGIHELDQVLGGGIVKGSVVLIGGEPGIGKSTVILQVSGILSGRNKNVLYVSGEESASQIRLRADRLKVTPVNLKLLSTTSFEDILSAVSNEKYDYLIIDSIQTISSSEIMSGGGAVGQIRHVTYRLVELAKSTGLTVFIIGQVTKDGNIAGPKVLEHLVDTVLYFEGDYTRGVRILRSVKNRFGSTDEVGIFEMSSSGLIEAGSRAFFDKDSVLASGKVICPVLEGTRPFLVEIQALVAPTFFQFPKRNANGFDNNRLAMLIAILEKKGGLNLSGADIYLNVAGGLKINEPSADLAVCASLISSFKDIAVPYTTAFAGEVGLTGEVRSVPNVQGRINECMRFGVTELNTYYKDENNSNIKINHIGNITDLVKILSNNSSKKVNK